MTEDIKPKRETVLDQPIESAAEVIKELEKKDEGMPSDKTVEAIAEEDIEDAEVKPAAETVHPEVPNEVVETGVVIHHESKDLEEISNPVQPVSDAPTDVNGSSVKLPTQEEAVFPPVFKTEELAKGDAAPLEQVAKERLGFLKFARLPKIFGGKKAA